MEQKQHHYAGLTDAEVLASRAKNGVNILTPPEEQSTWDKIRDCMHYWLLKVILGLFAAAVIAIVGLNIVGVTMPEKVDFSGALHHHLPCGLSWRRLGRRGAEVQYGSAYHHPACCVGV